MRKQPSYVCFSVVMFQKELNDVRTARGSLRLACEGVSGSPSNQEEGTTGEAGSLAIGEVVGQTLAPLVAPERCQLSFVRSWGHHLEADLTPDGGGLLPTMTLWGGFKIGLHIL